jgi:hypothetical protein
MTFRARVDSRDWRGNRQINQNAEPIPLDLDGKIFEFEISEASTFAPFILNGFAYDVTQRTSSS